MQRCHEKQSARSKGARLSPLDWWTFRGYVSFCFSVQGWGKGRMCLRRWPGVSVLIENRGRAAYAARSRWGERGKALGVSVGRGGGLIFFLGGPKFPLSSAQMPTISNPAAVGLNRNDSKHCSLSRDLRPNPLQICRWFALLTFWDSKSRNSTAISDHWDCDFAMWAPKFFRLTHNAYDILWRVQGFKSDKIGLNLVHASGCYDCIGLRDRVALPPQFLQYVLSWKIRTEKSHLLLPNLSFKRGRKRRKSQA